MYDSILVVNTKPLDLVSEAIARSPNLMKTAVKRNIGRLRGRMLVSIRAVRRKTYPLVWQSERQRRAFFATNGFGGGIPYSPTGNLLEGWDITVIDTDDGGILALTNDVPYARFVQGPDAQKMHLESHPQAADVKRQYEREAEEVLIQTAYLVIDSI